MNSSLNTIELIEWLINVTREYEQLLNRIRCNGKHEKKLDEFCTDQINRRVELAHCREHAKVQLKLFLSGKDSDFDKLMDCTGKRSLESEYMDNQYKQGQFSGQNSFNETIFFDS